MLIVLHQFGLNGNAPIYIVADEIEAISHSSDDGGYNSILSMSRGNMIPVTEMPTVIITKLQKILPERWGEPDNA